MHGPFEATIEVLVVNDAGDSAQIKYVCPSGKHTTPEMVDAAIATGLEQIEGMGATGWRRATKREYFDHIVEERTGSAEKWVMPGAKDWDPV